MKYPLLLLLFTIARLNASAQLIAARIDKYDIVYVGIDNPITIVVEGYACDALIVTTKNGTITGSTGHYILNPERPESLALAISAKTDTGIKQLGISVFHARCVPAPDAHLGYKNGGTISAGAMRKIGGPTAYTGDCANMPNNVITSFTITVKRGNEVLINRKLSNGSGVRFSDDKDVANMLQSLQKGDKILLENITYKNLSKYCNNELAPLDFTITE